MSEGVQLDERNIWDDPEAAAFVRSVARGHETVPTVVVGDDALVNPSPAEVLPVRSGESLPVFASWADDHAAASVLRAHSSWSSFFDFLVAEDLVEGNPMAAVGKPRRETGAPQAIRDPDAAARLLATAAQPDPRGRDPWPERDLPLAATFCVTGIREGEAVALGMGSLEGTPGARRLQVVGKGNKTRAVPIEGTLETVLEAHLATRRTRFPRHDLDHPSTPLSVDVRGRGLSVDQVKYLIERLYIRAGLRSGARRSVGARPAPHLRHFGPRGGADVVDLQTLLGHASLDTTASKSDVDRKRCRSAGMSAFGVTGAASEGRAMPPQL